MSDGAMWSPTKETLTMRDSASENGEPFLDKDRDHEAVLPARREPSRGQSRYAMVIVALVSALVSAIGTIIMHNLLPLPSASSPSASIASGAPAPPVENAPLVEHLPLLDLPPLGNLLRTYVVGSVNYLDKNVTKSREAWMSLFPPGMGYVSMDKIAENGEIPSVIENMATDGSGRFCVAAFHQLHCLYLIWEDYRNAMSGDLKSSTTTVEGQHSAHCFDYLRESIICAADNSMEPFRSPFDGGGTQGNGVDGFGTVHQCRDFKKLYDWSEKFRYGDGHDAHKFEG